MESTNQEPTKADVDKLLKFLPLLNAAIGQNPEPVELVQNPNGSYTPYIDYSKLGMELNEIIAKEPWRDFRYDSERALKTTNDPEVLNTASLSDIKNALFTQTRAERFCPGSWEGCINSGVFVRLLQRLAVIRQTME